ncbi:MAG: NAD-dependent protein deacylase [Candidatus Aegiribacteria sp.]|nr:NAD-dependent protein deacylase [Candidatus Aegiribacteria sp.]MBD3294671.1 NAD-dependent protein deacylase [Candidatus Fermentibacteria bacterium]
MKSRTVKKEVLRAAEMIADSRLPAVSTGAGMSRESGVRTFRGQEGFWKEYRAEDLASRKGLQKDPVLVWEWYRERLMATEDLKPHSGYAALKRIQRKKGKLPIITQNVDGLHQKAGLTDVIELHGSLRTASCLDQCGAPKSRMDDDLFRELPPRCPCGSILRPDVVLFGEQLPRDALERAFHIAGTCDLMLVIGTSMVVYPASSLPLIALRRRVNVIEINTEETPLTEMEGTVHISGAAGTVLPEIVKAVYKT